MNSVLHESSDAENIPTILAGTRLAEWRSEGNDASKAQCRAFGSRKFLVPLTLSADSRVSLAVARKLARESGAQLVLMHAVQLSITGEERGIPRSQLLNELCHDSERQLREWASDIGENSDIEIVVREGRPAEAIVETARCLDVDAIVLCAHNRCGPLNWLRRNTAEHVARQAPCPVWQILPVLRAKAIEKA